METKTDIPTAIPKKGKQYKVKADPLADTKVFRIPVTSVRDFKDKYTNGVSIQGIITAIWRGDIDFVKPGRDYLVCLTDKTLSYKFNSHLERH